MEPLNVKEFIERLRGWEKKVDGVIHNDERLGPEPDRYISKSDNSISRLGEQLRERMWEGCEDKVKKRNEEWQSYISESKRFNKLGEKVVNGFEAGLNKIDQTVKGAKMKVGEGTISGEEIENSRRYFYKADGTVVAVELKLSPPWIEYSLKVNAIFGGDPDVDVKFDDAAGSVKTLKLYVKGDDKASAIEELMPSEVTFGDVTVKVAVIPSNKLNHVDLIKRAFNGNPALSYIKSKELFGRDVTYVVFKKEVVQFNNDDLGDINRMESTLYEDLAREVFKENSYIYYCTDVVDEF